jgi:hypothetical protein
MIDHQSPDLELYNYLNNTFKLKIDFQEFYRSIIDSKKNVVIFSPSYPSVKFIIPFLQELKKNNINVELIVANDNLLNFYTKHYTNLYTHIVNINEYENVISIKRVWSLIVEKIVIKKLQNRIQYFSNSHVLFFSLDFVSRDFYLIRYLKKIKSNQLYLIVMGVLNSALPINSFKGLINLSMFRLIYGKELSLVKFGDSIFTRIKRDFFSDIKVVDVFPNNIANILDIPLNKISISQEIKVIYLDAPLEVLPDFEDKKQILETKLNLIKFVYSFLNSKFELGIKFHPGYKSNNEMLKYGVEIPSYIPSEFISLSNCRLVISPISLTLDKAYLASTPAVCLINLITWKYPKDKCEYFNLMNFINPELIFPESLDEFGEILKKILPNE